ncbi:MAG: tripartite tricarboxylate transporter permease [Desulfarculaceae bacterium]|nr:tripartite tricarboxylate transporter permease [Desulfarculaceae bacterium]
MLETLATAASQALTLNNFFGAALGIFLGSLLGAIPGLNGTMAIALLIPVTYTWSPLFAIAMLVGCWKGSVYGGSISAVLLNAPGTPESAATALDGYPLTKQGKAGKALKMALYASVIGALFSDALLMVASPPIAAMALMFGPAELAMLILFALVVVAGTGAKSQLKGLISTALGMLLATVGLDPITTQQRFTFGSIDLDAGIGLLAMLIGLLVMSEVLVQMEEGWKDAHAEATVRSDDPNASRVTWPELKGSLGTIFRSSLLGSFCGALPGVGSITAAFMGYDQARRLSKHPERFGKGDLNGVAAPEAANNAVCGAGLIPLVTLGIPGALSAAVIMGAFMIHGLAPGPMLMMEHPETIYGLFMLLIISDFFMLIIPLPLLRLGQWVISVPRAYLFPVILALCVIGAFGTHQNLFDVKVMVFFGVVGYLLKKWELSPAALLIAFILGPMAEVYLRQALKISGGDPSIFVTKPLAALFLALAVAAVIWTTLRNRRGKKPGVETPTSESTAD